MKKSLGYMAMAMAMGVDIHLPQSYSTGFNPLKKGKNYEKGKCRFKQQKQFKKYCKIK